MLQSNHYFFSLFLLSLSFYFSSMPHPLQVHVTKHVVTRVDYSNDAPPKYTKSYDYDYIKNNVFSNYPKTPSAPLPQCTTFSDSISSKLDSDDSGSDSDVKSGILDLDIPSGHTIICHPTEPGIYAIARPNTLARLLFLFGFCKCNLLQSHKNILHLCPVFPAFWILGAIILLMPLRPTPDWEVGKSPIQVEWSCEVIRRVELK